MLASGLLVGASPLALAEIFIPPAPAEQSSISLQLDGEARATFALRESVVRALDVEVDGVRAMVPLAGCIPIRGVRPDSVRLERAGPSGRGPAGSFVLTFALSPPGTTARLTFSRGALRDAELKRGGRAPDDALCPPIPGDATASPEQLVERLRGMPASVVPVIGGDDEARREALRTDTYRQLHAHGDAGVDALARALRDPEANMRQNAVAMLSALAGAWQVGTGLSKRSVVRAMPELIQALDDSDPTVRFLTAGALRDAGANGAPAVPTLVRMISGGDASDRASACLALGGIGPPARAALPLLKGLLDDADPVTRSFAATAIANIIGRPDPSSIAAAPSPAAPASSTPAGARPTDVPGMNPPPTR